MSLRSRLELMTSLRERYASAGRKQKSKILDEFTAGTGYGRKHAIAVLRDSGDEKIPVRRQRSRPRIYSEDVREALETVWEASNRLCSKRLVPYLSTFVGAMERFGHLDLDPETRQKLLAMSASTADRLLYTARHGRARPVTSTRPGPLLKHQIPVRTFTDWDDDRAGFLEADCVAHCGSTMAGTFLNSLVLTDVKTGWTECRALLYKDQDFVVRAIVEARECFPFPILGLDTDNGSEFITNQLMAFCRREAITFTRSRPYKKNDQCFVEQKNGAVVRRLVGYDRYEGLEAARLLAELYDVVRLYVNYFQPSMRLVSKSRLGAKMKRVYDRPRTPYDRVLEAAEVTATTKARMRRTYFSLDPVELLEDLRRLQDSLWQYGYRDLPSRRARRRHKVDELVAVKAEKPAEDVSRYFHTARRRHKPHKKHKPFVHWWRTYPDAFEAVWKECEQELADQPNLAASVLLERLQARHPGVFKDSQLRTLQRRVRAWRLSQMNLTLTRRTAGDSLPAEHEIELVVPYPTILPDEPARYDFE